MSLRRHQDPDAGFSLVEMAVTMLLASIVLALTVTIFSTAEHSSSTTQQRFTATADAADAMLVVTQALRAALPTTTAGNTQSSVTFVSAGANSVSFYASLGANDSGPAPTLVTFSATPVASGAYDELTESEVAATGTPPAYTFTSTPRTSILAYWLNPTAANASGAIFQYYAAGSTAPMTAPVALANIASIGVTITCATGPNQPESTMQATVYPPNLALANGVVGI